MWGPRQKVVLAPILLAVFSIGLVAQQPSLAPPVPRPASSKATKKKVQKTSADLGRDTTFALLEEAYSASSDLSSQKRIPLLGDVCQIASSMNSKAREMVFVYDRGSGNRTSSNRNNRISPSLPAQLTKKQRRQVKDWSEELFRLGQEFPSGSSDRSTAETMATRCMVPIDTDRALEMLEGMDPTPGNPLRNPRLSVVSALFSELYAREGLRAVPDLRREALALGDDGSYPFQAVLNLLNQLNGHPEIVRQFFADAVTYYARNDADRPQTYGMLGLVSSKEIRHQLDDWQVQNAVQEIVSRMQELARNTQNIVAGGEEPDRPALMLMRQVKTSLKRFAPDYAASIPDPAGLSPDGAAYFLPANSSGRKLPQAPAPDDALKSLRAAFEANRTSLMKMGENEIHDGPEMQQTIERTVDLGARMVQRTVQAYDPEDRAVAMQTSSRELSGVIRLGSHVNPAATLAAIRQVQDSELQTRLLLVAARTIEYLH